ncbi:B3 domain-containing protein REM20-like [Salvia divinorum]|uniref:B3 domain-containing protein REM20-like n=1 Tax=Salvia divinorum TaxID=28513 RepID=A0ABD1HIN9_SALDI
MAKNLQELLPLLCLLSPVCSSPKKAHIVFKSLNVLSSSWIDHLQRFVQSKTTMGLDNALRRGDLLIFTYERHGFFSLKQYWAGTRFPPFDLAEALGMESDEIDTSDDDGDVSLSQDANGVADAGSS